MTMDNPKKKHRILVLISNLVFFRVVLFLVFCMSRFDTSAQNDNKFIGMERAQIFIQHEDSLINSSYLGWNGWGLFNSTSIYDTLSDHIIASDGLVIRNDLGDTLVNMGLYLDSLNGQNDIFTFQSSLLLPKKEQQYYYIYTSMSDSGFKVFNSPFDQFNYLVLDMSVGKGVVKGKRNRLLDRPLQSGHITATRHANGRDWWLLQKEASDSTYFIFLVTPDTIVLDHIQYVGKNSLAESYGFSFFSAQGDKLVYTDVDQITQVFNFNRCSGMLTGVKYIHSKWYDVNGRLVSSDTVPGMLGGIFSPSGRYLYLNNYHSLTQFDLQAKIIDSSAVLIARVDSSYLNLTKNVFNSGFLSKNNKIYYDEWDGSSNGSVNGALHVINKPDSAGIKCNFKQNSFPILSFSLRIFPNMPSYRPGVLVGSGCDTAFTTGVQVVTGEWGEAATLLINPVTDQIEIVYHLQGTSAGSIELYDINGRRLRIGVIAGYEGSTKMDVADLANGAYLAKLTADNGWSKSFKVIITR
jgi:Secretion system C-terminal sorting domain